MSLFLATAVDEKGIDAATDFVSSDIRIRYPPFVKNTVVADRLFEFSNFFVAEKTICLIVLPHTFTKWFVVPLSLPAVGIMLSRHSTRTLDIMPSFSLHRVSLLHGKMTSAEKNRTLSDFSEGKTGKGLRVLVSTSIIEVRGQHPGSGDGGISEGLVGAEILAVLSLLEHETRGSRNYVRALYIGTAQGPKPVLKQVQRSVRACCAQQPLMICISDPYCCCCCCGWHAFATSTAVKVGVDVPRAAVCVVENAEMFGLSQLHQLRGRLGRTDRGRRDREQPSPSTAAAPSPEVDRYTRKPQVFTMFGRTCMCSCYRPPWPHLQLLGSVAERIAQLRPVNRRTLCLTPIVFLVLG